jgi:DNA-binding response OmpR family regulator
VDDDPKVLESLRDLMVKDGHEVLTAGSAKKPSMS